MANAKVFLVLVLKYLLSEIYNTGALTCIFTRLHSRLQLNNW